MAVHLAVVPEAQAVHAGVPQTHSKPALNSLSHSEAHHHLITYLVAKRHVVVHTAQAVDASVLLVEAFQAAHLVEVAEATAVHAVAALLALPEEVASATCRKWPSTFPSS